ncbi:FMN-dependent NADH-azoreductase [Burkholderia lata]|uniref:FMN-dependent NADH:quinone oxidoreductase 5 n=1 Tax=Burkholderia lata (strain ATCC 17760 / DSM 23089 / LMG 22485 / NCIMB 9086 / R18194 / 383) TaxID=482957 RepID=AZOR5_BURL3|nr:NAD(P)H-dependent oxidoreductase [Burkholderia lata]Q390D0.1 RecName: Full=FMN-dependent NADH:quinone oxidoreductase 5; AltName: Full=Azo-dye reductase 5; AltName: Full=FMN-dependent NADH-azo compound oxidoreductase 5; AltName: Full=FMN-dependent NADH-azoreductase 5 [Burkholderia lata]ABB13186.1 (Acyl-carrier protein) phosphodiesterase [Burkholderia lata]
MNNLLFVDASPHGSRSLGARIAREAIAQWQAAHPHARVVSRSLGQPGLPSISADYAHALVARQPDSDPALACSEQLIAEVEHSDGVLISTPMHNFTVPAALKLWIDFVLRIGRTFAATPEGKVGLLADRPVLVLVRSGGICRGAAARQPDFLTPYLKQVLAVIGFSTVDFIYLEGVAPDDAAIDAVRGQLAQSALLARRATETA